MKIGILSDTHKKVGRARKAIELLVKQGVKTLIHAGDLVTKENLDLLKETGLPYYAVFGNNDYALLGCEKEYHVRSEPYAFEIEGVTFSLMHHPFHVRSQRTDVVVFGHTHERHQSFDGVTLTLNPGEVCARDTSFSEVMVLEVSPSEFTVTQYIRAIGEEAWKEVQTRYPR